MLVSSALTIGQATFILRVLIQALTYGGGFLLGLIVLAYAPRVGAIQTHDVLNRIVGQITVTGSAGKWLLWRVTGKSKGHPPSRDLIMAIAIFLLYTIFVSLSDIGFIGFHECSVPFPDHTDFPASVKTAEEGLSLIRAVLVNASDISNTRVFRCDSSVAFTALNHSYSSCTAWHNSTYDDPNAFQNLNTTDSDTLIPRRLFADSIGDFYVNYVARHIEGVRITTPNITNGMAIVPYPTGVKAVFGVPQLQRNQSVHLSKALAVEADVGCMSTGILSQNDILHESFTGGEKTFLALSDGWRTYSGPDYLRDVLSRAVDRTRDAIRPLLNSTGTDGSLYTDTKIFNNIFEDYTSVSDYFFPSATPGVGDSVLGNCTQELMQQLAIPPPPPSRHTYSPTHCGLLQLGASLIADSAYEGLRKFICATATNITMVSATVRADADNTISMDLTQLPSDLNTVYADYWEVLQNSTGPPDFSAYDGILRFTLSDNPNGQLTHPILQDSIALEGQLIAGAGSPGHVFTKLGARMLRLGVDDEVTLGILSSDFFAGRNALNPEQITRWAGQMGASYLAGSLAYSGYAARDSPALTVTSLGGRRATCFTPPYGVAFLPLLFVAVMILAWTFLILLRASFSQNKKLQNLYGGLAPYEGVVSTATKMSPDSVLAWENHPRPHLQAVHDGGVVEGDRKDTLVEYVEKSGSKISS